jgi:hypothetical protein
LLEEAERVAETGDDWASIAEVWLQIGDVPAARRSIATALAAPYDSSTFIQVALLLQRDLADTNAARAALQACERYLVTEHRSWLHWIRTARAYVQILDDRVHARVMFERRAVSADPHELVELAKGYVEVLDDRDAALALLHRADAARLPYYAVTIAEAYRDLVGDAQRARLIVDGTLADTNDFRVALSIVYFAPRSQRGDAIALERTAFANAESLATTVEDWIMIAEQHCHRDQRDDARRCLERAVAIATTSDERRQIADVYRYHLDDLPAAEALGPTGLPPNKIARAHHTLDGWSSDPARLLDWLRPQLDAKQLDTLATAAGSEREMHLAVLADIWRSGLVPHPLGWHPREALELERWKTGIHADPRRCAFACAILLIDTTGPIYRDAFEPSIAMLVESCRELGDEALDGAIGLLVTLAESFEPRLPDIAFALLGLLLAAAARDPLDPRLPALCDRLITIVADFERRFTVDTPEWLLGLTGFDSRHAVFRSLVTSVLGSEAAPPHLGAIAARLRTTRP